MTDQYYVAGWSFRLAPSDTELGLYDYWRVSIIQLPTGSSESEPAVASEGTYPNKYLEGLIDCQSLAEREKLIL